MLFVGCQFPPYSSERNNYGCCRSYYVEKRIENELSNEKFITSVNMWGSDFVTSKCISSYIKMTVSFLLLLLITIFCVIRKQATYHRCFETGDLDKTKAVERV